MSSRHKAKNFKVTMTSVYIIATLKEIMLATAGEPIYQQHAVRVSSNKLGESPSRRELQ